MLLLCRMSQQRFLSSIGAGASPARVRRVLIGLYLFAALGDAVGKAVTANASIGTALARNLPGNAAPTIDSSHVLKGTFQIFRAASRRLLHGEDLYTPYPEKHSDRFKYSPTFALLFAPLAWLPWPLGLFLWSALNALVLFAAVEQLLPARQANFALACLLLEVLRSMQTAQSNALVAALIVLAFIALEHGRAWRAAGAVVLGAFIKIFPLAALTFAIPRRKTLQVAVAALVVGVVLAVAPLLVATPTQLIAHYRSWMFTESHDALERWFSVMALIHQLFGTEWPNWPVQLVGTLFLLLPLAIRRDRWSDERFRMTYLCSVLVYLTLFNHQAERASYLIAFVGASIWFLLRRRAEAWAPTYDFAGG